MKQVTIADFWKSDQNCASANDILTFCKGCGLQLSTHDLINLKGEVFHNREMLYLEQFAELVPYWKEQGREMIADFLKKRSDALL